MFMAKTSLDDGVFDRSAYQNAKRQLRLVETELPQNAVSSLAREVVRRLAFRMPRHENAADLPTQSEIDLLCAALLSADDTAADQFILAARRDGVDVGAISRGYVAGAARKLGQMWDDDRISFIDVTLACGKLYGIIRGLRHVLAPQIIQGRETRPALFALVPGETHTLGIEIATDHFRRDGWDVDMLMGLDHDAMVSEADLRHYEAIVLVANSDRMLEPLTRLSLALRITQPLAHIIVAGGHSGSPPRYPAPCRSRGGDGRSGYRDCHPARRAGTSENLACGKGRDDRGKIDSLQAGPADQRACDMWHGKDGGRIVAFDRPAIQDAETGTIGKARGQPRVDMGMNLRDLVGGGHLASADSPDRFIGDHGIVGGCAIGHRSGQLRINDIQRRASLALHQRFTDTDDRDQPRIMCGA
jgi:methanogenic corrinoid protein MtbC1